MGFVDESIMAEEGKVAFWWRSRHFAPS